MNTKEEKYTQFALCREMIETSEIVKNFNPDEVSPFVKTVKGKKGLFLTGEGSSRIFPAKRVIYNNLKHKGNMSIQTEGSAQAIEYDLSDYAVVGASNSGKTGEVIRLFDYLKSKNHNALLGLTANSNTPLEDLADHSFILACGKEKAVAATKSVIEQGLFYDTLVSGINGETVSGLSEAADKISEVLSMDIDSSIIDKITNAGTIYFAGRNNGVAEELTLKTNEITRTKSDYLEGTYGIHGIEEVMQSNDVLIIIDPFKNEEQKFREYLKEGVGMEIIAISSNNTLFPTIKIPESNRFKEYIELAAGWNLLVEIGMSMQIDLDNPVRARKIGNEFIAES